jgi:hypothetical protein
MGYLEKCRGNKVYAHDWLQRALKLCSKIQDAALYKWMENLILETIAELK